MYFSDKIVQGFLSSERAHRTSRVCTCSLSMSLSLCVSLFASVVLSVLLLLVWVLAQQELFFEFLLNKNFCSCWTRTISEFLLNKNFCSCWTRTKFEFLLNKNSCSQNKAKCLPKVFPMERLTISLVSCNAQAAIQSGSLCDLLHVAIYMLLCLLVV